MASSFVEPVEVGGAAAAIVFVDKEWRCDENRKDEVGERGQKLTAEVAVFSSCRAELSV
jgi:hypothetical protein